MPKFVNDPVSSESDSATSAAVYGESKANEGVRGVSHGEHGAVVAINDYAPLSPPGAGGNAGWFESSQGEGVRGWAKSGHHGGVVGVNTGGGFAVYGTSDAGTGVVGESKTSEGVRGVSHGEHAAVVGVNDYAPDAPPKAGGAGGWFESSHGEGVRGTSNSTVHAGVLGVNTAKGNAGHFVGNVEVTGDLILSGADCAEAFAVADADLLECGMVAVVDYDGLMRPCDRSYDTRVAGIVSGAGGLKPAIVLDRRPGAVPIALMGTAWCWCDATESPIAPGDLLTSSDRPGHARRADDMSRAFGALLGKALSALPSGTGLVRVMIIPG